MRSKTKTVNSDHGGFARKIKEVVKRLQSKGIQFRIKESVGALKSYRNPEYGATRTLEQVRGKNDPQE